MILFPRELGERINVSLPNRHNVNLWLGLVVQMGESSCKECDYLLTFTVSTFSHVLLADHFIRREIKHLLKLRPGEEGVRVQEVVAAHRPEQHKSLIERPTRKVKVSVRCLKCFLERSSNDFINRPSRKTNTSWRRSKSLDAAVSDLVKDSIFLMAVTASQGFLSLTRRGTPYTPRSLNIP